ncbi:hypothetical protein B0H14DRAFT_3157893 [Mycena olivaceomarginata]|nr:hypothetical protein B0H14DRAFT_3157893 [Mycena olivaceomarginata]
MYGESMKEWKFDNGMLHHRRPPTVKLVNWSQRTGNLSGIKMDPGMYKLEIRSPADHVELTPVNTVEWGMILVTKCDGFWPRHINKAGVLKWICCHRDANEMTACKNWTPAAGDKPVPKEFSEALCSEIDNGHCPERPSHIFVISKSWVTFWLKDAVGGLKGSDGGSTTWILAQSLGAERKNDSPRAAYASEEHRRLRSTHNAIPVRWEACDKYFPDDVEWESAGRRNKGLVGVHRFDAGVYFEDDDSVEEFTDSQLKAAIEEGTTRRLNRLIWSYTYSSWTWFNGLLLHGTISYLKSLQTDIRGVAPRKVDGAAVKLKDAGLIIEAALETPNDRRRQRLRRSLGFDETLRILESGIVTAEEMRDFSYYFQKIQDLLQCPIELKRAGMCGLYLILLLQSTDQLIYADEARLTAATIEPIIAHLNMHEAEGVKSGEFMEIVVSLLNLLKECKEGMYIEGQ